MGKEGERERKRDGEREGGRKRKWESKNDRKI